MNGFPNRVVMLDLSRLLETKAYYRGLLPWFRAWGYTGVHLHFADDQGSALIFPSHPEFAKDGAFTAEEMRDFVRAAEAEGLAVIPEVETLGHTQFITKLDRYAHLGGDGSGHFNALDPHSDAAVELLHDLLNDVVDIFPGEIVHLGLDEVNLGCLPRFKTAAPDTLWRIFAEHAAHMHDLVRQLGRRPAMWGDHILSSPAMIELFERDVLIFDWHYEARVDPASLGFFCDRGHEVWACPATSSWLYTRGLPNADNLGNLRHFSGVAALYRDQGVTGMVNTVWCPWRYLPGGVDWPMALGGHLFSVEQENPDFALDYVADFYGLNDGRQAPFAEAIDRLHAIAPSRRLVERVLGNGPVNDPFTRDDVRACRAIAAEAKGLMEVLQTAAGKAGTNGERLQDLVVTARFVMMLAEYGAAGRTPCQPDAVTELVDACRAAWQRDRCERWDSPGLANCGNSIVNLAQRLAAAPPPGQG